MISLDRRVSASAKAAASGGRQGLGLALMGLIAVVLTLMPAPVSAGLILQVENASARAGGTGSFDVVLSAGVIALVPSIMRTLSSFSLL
jgi:hypothetical protein